MRLKTLFFSFFPPFISFFFFFPLFLLLRADLTHTFHSLECACIAAPCHNCQQQQGKAVLPTMVLGCPGAWPTEACHPQAAVPCPQHQIAEYGFNDFCSPQLVCAAQHIDAKDLPVETQMNCFVIELL